METLRRYAPIVDDVEAFLTAASTPLPRVVWANRVRIGDDAMADLMGRRCPQAEPLAYLDGTWRVPADGPRPGKWPEFTLGLIHTQEEVSLWPVTVLDPRPGEAVLDLCAAPGNKTARMAVAMSDAGSVLANDRRWSRIQGIQDIVARMGLTSVMASHGDGGQLPGQARFDRVLVDAPCTGEGTTRKARGRSPELRNDYHKLQAVQKGLLRRAVELTRPGGVIVYSTCTYAPEENEAVLDGIYPEKAAIEPIELPAEVTVDAGVAEWQGERFRADTANAVRFWPHHNDTGGFFVARLRRL
ncbi:MAG TPA: RsmB/NOP family class I SAM-dependent RNA methyltransferase [Gammaproteobacteria bacterium]|nr:RsmB/NOP family class I SAM-dependent RNA methyltransferase [Gammaproteobacteria bacterium]